MADNHEAADLAAGLRSAKKERARAAEERDTTMRAEAYFV